MIGKKYKYIKFDQSEESKRTCLNCGHIIDKPNGRCHFHGLVGEDYSCLKWIPKQESKPESRIERLKRKNRENEPCPECGRKYYHWFGCSRDYAPHKRGSGSTYYACRAYGYS